VPNEAQPDDLCFVPERAVVDQVGGNVTLARGDEGAGGEDVPQGVEVVLVDGFVGYGWVVGDGAREGQVGVAPFLGEFPPLLVGLGTG
jgi:hypothetical protein